MPRTWLTTLLALVVLALPIGTAAAEEVPRLVRVELGSTVTVESLMEAGLDVVEIKRGSHCMVIEWPGDEVRIRALGATVTVVDADPARTMAERARRELERMPRPPQGTARGGGALLPTAPPPVGSGSMGGFWTLAEVKMKLDQLVAEDTQDLVADVIDSIGTTRQNRPVWGLRIGKAVLGPDDRPVAFYSALTHAREPEGMQALFYFVDDLLSKYGTDPTATYLLDHRVIYIVPVVNPDGYLRNQTTNPGGGGLWRKNLRDNNGNSVVDTNDGVDLNRNYGFGWGLPGASSSPGSDTYRGPSAFSEPETQAQRNIVSSLQAVTGLSFHTFGDYFLSPWSYTAAAPPDSAKFHEWNADVTRGGHYISGEGPRILYVASGEFNDWCYGDTILKPRSYTWTPEVGNNDDFFWPPPSRIVPLAIENLRHCYYVASIAGPYVRVESSTVQEGALNAGFTAHIAVRARNKGISGLAGPGLAATLQPLSAGASVLSGPVAYPDLGSFQSADAGGGATFEVAADDTVTPGRLLRFRIDFSASDGYFSRDTVEVVCGTPTLLFSDGASAGMGLWTGGWGVESIDPSHVGPYFSDSPGGNYPQSADDPSRITAPLDLSAGVHAYALYDARWMFEQDYDCGSVEASLDGVNWTPVPATSTALGGFVSGSVQPTGLPIYAGARYLWQPERADLSAFAGPNGNAVRFRFRVRSDVGTQFDGMQVDDVRIVVYDPAQQPLPVAVGDSPASLFDLSPPTPNPARTPVRLGFSLPVRGQVRLEVMDVQGRRVRTLADGVFGAGRYAHGWDLRDERGHPVGAGVYLARLSGRAGTVTRRFVVMR
jgi:hypothetical protein